MSDREAVLQRERGNASLPMARVAERVVQSAASQLELLVAEVRRDWQARISGLPGRRAAARREVAAIENGAAHRLSFVCDELREAMTVQLVRLVLELSRPLRQELHHRRLEVARGNSPKLDEAFEEVRMVFPSSVEATFVALQTPALGAIMTGERGFSIAVPHAGQGERECLGRLVASLDDIERTTARQLYEAAANLSPLLLTTFERIVAELLTAHERWIDNQLAVASRDEEALREKRQPALALINPLEDAEAKLSGRLREPHRQ